MKIEFNEFGGFTMNSEDGRDILWFKEMIENLGTQGRKDLDAYFEVDLESMYVMGKTKDGESIPATGITLAEAVDKEGIVWGSVEMINFTPFSF